MSSDEKTVKKPQVYFNRSTPAGATGKWQIHKLHGSQRYWVCKPDGTFWREFVSNVYAYEIVKEKNAALEATERATFAAKEWRRAYDCLKGLVQHSDDLWASFAANGEPGENLEKPLDDPWTAQARQIIEFYENPIPLPKIEKQ